MPAGEPFSIGLAPPAGTPCARCRQLVAGRFAGRRGGQVFCMDCFLAACPPLGTFLELEATLADFGREAEVVGPEERPVLLATVYQLLRRAAALRAVDWPECFEAEETSA